MKKHINIRSLLIMFLFAALASCGGASQQSGSFKSVSSMNYQRSYHTATLLNNGKVLVAGGLSAGATAELYDPVTNSWAVTGSMTNPRFSHTATLLQDGTVLVAGGYQITGATIVPSTASAEIYDPIAGSWTPTANMNTPRAKQTATLLADGTVLVAGGVSADNGTSYSTTYNSSEIYDPTTRSWSWTTGSMSQGRNSHTATLLANGKVLVTGGDTYTGSISSGSTPVMPTATAEIYDPNTKGWTPVSSMATARTEHQANLMADGTVLIVGGQDSSGKALNSVESFVAPTPTNINGSWSTLLSMKWSRDLFAATLLPGGTVLATGGKNTPIIYSSSELFDPVKSSWSDTGNMTTSRFAHTATLLQNGQVLITGGTGITSEMSSAELYKP